jgi:hypothetical protein
MLVVETAHSLNAWDPTTLLGHDHKEPDLTLCRWVYHMPALDETMADMRRYLYGFVESACRSVLRFGWECMVTSIYSRPATSWSSAAKQVKRSADIFHSSMFLCFTQYRSCQ